MDVRATAVIAAAECSATAEDRIVLSYNDRHRRRLRMSTESGKSFVLDLEAAVAIRDGDQLQLTDGSRVTVLAKPERVLDVVTEDADHLLRIAWHLGNRHLPTQVFPERLRIRYDHIILDMLTGLGATVSELNAPFQPEGGAYAGGHHHD